MINIIIITFLIFFINFFLKKKNWLCSYTGNQHQRFANKENIPLSGGFFLLLVIYLTFDNFGIYFYVSIQFLFLIGIFSDLDIIKSPNKRFILQILIILFFIIFTNLAIESTRIFAVDYLLQNQIFNYLFVLFCIAIIVNGNNFLDGLNTLVLGYYLSVLFIIYYLNLNETIDIDDSKFINFLFIILILFIFNFFNKLFLGDSGAYLVGFSLGIILIKISLINQNISPFFILHLLWYPGFENLFSIIRKILIGKSPLKPDKNHLHQLLYSFIEKKSNSKSYFVNSLSAQLIILYNIIIFLIAAQNIYSTQYQILLILFNLMIYLVVYLRLFYLKFKGRAVLW